MMMEGTTEHPRTKEQPDHSKEDSADTQATAEKEVEMTNHSKTNNDGSNNASGDDNSSNPLFKLVNAAASIMSPPGSQESYENKEENKDEVMTDTTNNADVKAATDNKTTTSAEETADKTENPGTNEETTPTNGEEKTTPPADDDSAKTSSSPSHKPKSPPPNVLQGTKEDLMQDPKIKISFAEHLYNVLENPEHHDVLNWMPDGLNFTVVNHKKFVLQKMPTLFQIRNMSSFVRKLGRWGFSRVFEKETNNSDVFKHPHFHRGDRAGVRKNVKCLGRAAGPKANQQQQKARQPDFVVCQEPGKPPMVMPTAANATPNPLHQAALEQHYMRPHSLSANGGFTSAQMGGLAMPGATGGFGSPPSHSLDEVTNASSASAEALYFSHQQSQKAKMEQLASADQHMLEDLEIQRLMKRREMRQQQKMQQRLFMEQQQQRRYMMEHQQQQHDMGGSHRGMSTSGRGMVMDTSGSSAHMDASQRSSNMLMQHYQGGGGMTQHMPHNDLRRVSMQHPMGSSSLDGSLGRSSSSRYSAMNDAAAQVTPTYDTHKALGAAYDSLQRDEIRSRERQAAIRALLAEEQDFEARRAAMGGGGGGQPSVPPSSFGATMRG